MMELLLLLLLMMILDSWCLSPGPQQLPGSWLEAAPPPSPCAAESITLPLVRGGAPGVPGSRSGSIGAPYPYVSLDFTAIVHSRSRILTILLGGTRHPCLFGVDACGPSAES